MSEKQGYRHNLGLLNRAFPEKNILDVYDVKKYLGLGRNITDEFLKKNGFKQGTRLFISKTDLARLISG